jgi:hypothetical protein
LRSGRRQGTVIVAVVAVRVVQMAGDAIIHMIAVRHRLVTTAGPVRMPRLMPAATMVRGAALGVLARYLDHMFVDMIFVGMVQVTVVQIVDVAAVAHCGMSAAWPVPMSVIAVGRAGASRHGILSFSCPKSADTPVRLSAA